MRTETKQNEKSELVNTDKIRLLADNKRLSMAKLGRLIGMNRQTMHTRIHKLTPMTADELLQIADHLGVSVDELRKKP